MPRLSLYKPEKGPDYEFLDNQILEMFTVGGVDMHLHKLMGHSLSEAQIEDGVTNLDALSVQDMLFLENRDRSYEKDVYTIRCVYNVADLDFDLSGDDAEIIDRMVLDHVADVDWDDQEEIEYRIKLKK